MMNPLFQCARALFSTYVRAGAERSVCGWIKSRSGGRSIIRQLLPRRVNVECSPTLCPRQDAPKRTIIVHCVERAVYLVIIPDVDDDGIFSTASGGLADEGSTTATATPVSAERRLKAAPGRLSRRLHRPRVEWREGREKPAATDLVSVEPRLKANRRCAPPPPISSLCRSRAGGGSGRARGIVVRFALLVLVIFPRTLGRWGGGSSRAGDRRWGLPF